MSNQNSIYRRANLQPRPAVLAPGEPLSLFQIGPAISLFCNDPLRFIDKKASWENSLLEAKNFGKGLTQ